MGADPQEREGQPHGQGVRRPDLGRQTCTSTSTPRGTSGWRSSGSTMCWTAWRRGASTSARSASTSRAPRASTSRSPTRCSGASSRRRSSPSGSVGPRSASSATSRSTPASTTPCGCGGSRTAGTRRAGSSRFDSRSARPVPPASTRSPRWPQQPRDTSTVPGAGGRPGRRMACPSRSSSASGRPRSSMTISDARGVARADRCGPRCADERRHRGELAARRREQDRGREARRPGQPPCRLPAADRRVPGPPHVARPRPGHRRGRRRAGRTIRRS